MDKFEEFSKNIAAMDGVRRAVTIAGQKDRCACGVCPTYNECMREKGEVFYCITGRSPVCTFEKKACICPMCPVKFTLGLQKGYYCIRGSEQDQRTSSSPHK
ncbi:MAG: DUF2769 domain-containing protein [Methanoregula sp.]|nr:MAG: DUF2769 domain-containing protein [Methanoregula sp.]